MANTEQPERGIQKPYDARYGITVGGCRGLYIAHDSSVLEDEQLYDAINVRVQDGIVLSRYGQSAPTNASAMEGCVQGLIDIENAGPRFILATNRSDSLANASDIDMFSRLATTPYVRVTDQPNNSNPLSGQPTKGQLNLNTFDATRPRYVLGFWDGAVIFAGANYDSGGALETSFKIFKILVPDDAVSADSIQAEALFDCKVPGEGSYFEPTSMVVLPAIAVDIGVREPLYFGTLGGGVVAYVNGELVRLQAEGTFAGRVIVFQYNNRLYAAGDQELRVQDGWVTGGSPVSTSWTNVALPGGVTSFQPMCAIEWSGFGWIGGFDDSAGVDGFILKIDDSSGTPVVTVAIGAAASYLSFDDFAVGLGGMFVGSRFDTGTSQEGRFSSFDGTTLTTLAQWTEDGGVPRLVGHRSAIYISAWATGNAPGGGVGRSIWEWDGSSIAKLVDVVDASGEESPFDMVLF